MTRKMPPPGETQATVTMFKEGHRTYERRYVDCGKDNCQRCNRPGGRLPSHGPYWYLCVPRKGKWFRIYLGKQLDTTKFVDKNGNIEWDLVKHAKARRAANVAPETDCPGQEDMIDQKHPAAKPRARRGPAHVKRLEDNLEMARDHVQDPLPGGKTPLSTRQEDSTPQDERSPRGTA